MSTIAQHKDFVLGHLLEQDGFTSIFWVTSTSAIASAVEQLESSGRIERIEDMGYPAMRFKINQPAHATPSIDAGVMGREEGTSR